MLDYEKQRKLVILFMIGVVLVVIFLIVSLIVIWTPEPEKELEYQVGVVENISVKEQDMIQRYYTKISEMFIKQDFESIFSLIGEDYLNFNEYNKDDVKKYLNQKSVLGKRLELVDSKTYMVDGYSNVYYLDFKVANEIYSLNVVVREKSPENYTIAFDKFIDYKEDVYNDTINSIGLNIYEQIRYTNSVEYRFKLTNHYSNEVTINNNSLANAVLLVGTQAVSRVPIMTTLATTKVKLKFGDRRNFTAVFPIKDELDYISYRNLVLKDVVYSGLQGTTDIEYTI